MARDDERAGGAARSAAVELPTSSGGDRKAGLPDTPPVRPSRAPASALPIDRELERYRSRLDEQLTRRSNAQGLTRINPPALPVERPPLTLSRVLNALREVPRWLMVAPVVAALAIGAPAWWTLRQPASAVAATNPSPPPARTAPAPVDQALQQERDKSEQLSRELSVVWRELNAKTLALADKAAQESELADLRKTLKQTEELASAYELLLTEERQRSQALDEQLIARREAVTAANAGSAAQGQEIAAQRETLKQMEERLADYTQRLSAAAADKAAKEQELGTLRQALKQAAITEQALAQERRRSGTLKEQLAADKSAREREVESLRLALKQAQDRSAGQEQSLARERSRVGQLEAELATRRQTVAADAAVDKSAKPAAVADKADDPPAPIVVSADLDLPRLMARARLLLVQGDIAAARSVLEHAAASGSAPALFALAETFDPAVLSAWGTVGTQGDAARAQELYAKAFAGGVMEAKERMAALR